MPDQAVLTTVTPDLHDAAWPSTPNVTCPPADPHVRLGRITYRCGGWVGFDIELPFVVMSGVVFVRELLLRPLRFFIER